MSRFLLFSIVWIAWVLPAGAAPPGDLEILWSGSLHLAADGSPLIPVGIESGQASIEVVPKGQVILRSGKRHVAARPGRPLIVTLRGGKAATLVHRVVVEEFPFEEGEAASLAVEAWKKRGFPASSTLIGGVHHLGPRRVDNRSHQILLGPPGTRREAEDLIARVAASFPDVQPRPFAELVRRPSGAVEVRDERGRLLLTGQGVVVLEAASVLVKSVEHSHGYANHGREDRTYPGPIHFTVGSDGKLAAANVVPVEELLRGIVPSEIYATAPMEALKAQAVTARGEVLAKIGVRHRTDPWAICAEQHCQVYKGSAGFHQRTDEAISSSRGEYLFSPGGVLVDSVFSSTCGGHTENNEAVWGTRPDPSLRGVPDWIEPLESLAPFAGKVDDVAAWLGLEVPGLCGVGGFSRADKYRWVRQFSGEEMDTVGRRLGVGKVLALTVTGRGVSGRATGLAFQGEQGEIVVRGELRIRRLLGNLNSSLFVVERDPGGGWRFRGAGWGHGVGMCQTGAIGRAERGQDYRAILAHYYNGAGPVALY